jgi:membrane protein DedA with SNARE-associated domain
MPCQRKAERVSAAVQHYIAAYGYAAIFLLVLAQELGVPNPVTNEFVLLFSGYLSYSGALRFWPVFATAVCADCLGTAALYAIFYRFGGALVRRRPCWFPLSPERLQSLAARIARRPHWGVYLARLIPFLRGYASVAAGILTVPARIFLPAVALSAITWSGGYVAAGRLLGPYWDQAAGRIGRWETAALALGILAAAPFPVCALVRKLHRRFIAV